MEKAGFFINPTAALIKQALIALDVQPFNAAYVTFDPSELRAAANTRVGTLLVGESSTGCLPDVMADIEASNLPEAISVLLKIREGRLAGYAGESFAHGFASGLPLSDALYVSRSALSQDIPGVQVYWTGRYFPSADPRHEKHALTQRLLRLKNRPDLALPRVLAAILEWMLPDISETSVITRVAPKPSTSSDNLGQLLVQAAKIVDTKKEKTGSAAKFPRLATLCDLCAIACPTDFPRQRDVIGGKENRSRNVRGRFQAGSQVRGKQVILIDDILTTGSTASECAKAILDEGATSVRVFAFARDQKVITAPHEDLVCPQCGLPMQLRFNANIGNAFFGCTGWPDCKATYTIHEGLNVWNRRNVRDMLDDDPDVVF
ncbi:MAG: ComF family protein [Bacillota bacterium]